MFEIMLKTYIIYYQIVDLLFNTYKGTPYNVNETHCQCFPHCSQIFKLFGFLIFRFWAYLMKVILSVPDEGYFERTWWRLFWAYLMKVILSVPDEGYFINASCALNLISTFSLTLHTQLIGFALSRIGHV
jgi:hypothetical protein